MFATRSLSRPVSQVSRFFSSLYTINPISAMAVYRNSCYSKIDFKINENCNVKEAINRYNAFNVGCLAVMSDSHNLVGVVAERDFISQVAAHDMNPIDVKVKDICTRSLIVARATDSIHSCMNKMMVKNIRHLVIIDDNANCIGMISIRDLIKEVNRDNQESIARLTDFNLGKGAYYGSE